MAYAWVNYINPLLSNPIVIAMLEEAQHAVKLISGKVHKKKVKTSAFFITLLSEQLGQVAKRYIYGGRKAEKIEVDIADLIVTSLAYLNWLGKDASSAFEKALDKHEKAMEEWEGQA